jgi:hypothetical protein
MDLMPDQHTTVVTAVDGPQGLLDPRAHRTQVIRRLLATGISAATLRAIVPEWSETITDLDEQQRLAVEGSIAVR